MLGGVTQEVESQEVGSQKVGSQEVESQEVGSQKVESQEVKSQEVGSQEEKQPAPLAPNSTKTHSPSITQPLLSKANGGCLVSLYHSLCVSQVCMYTCVTGVFALHSTSHAHLHLP